MSAAVLNATFSPIDAAEDSRYRNSVVAVSILTVLSAALTVFVLRKIFPSEFAIPWKKTPNPNSQPDVLDFSGVVPYKDNFQVENEPPIPYYRRSYIRDYVYTVTMAIQKLAFDDWVAMDLNYAERMAFKHKIITENGVDAMDCREGGYEGCEETLEYLVEYLPKRFPTMFSLSLDKNTIHNHITKEAFDLRKPLKEHPLYVIGRLIEDDFVVLVEGPDGEYVLKATLSAFPAGFKIQEKMDKPMSAIHKPVPLYKEKLDFSMTRYFRTVKADKLVMRLNWSINDKKELFLIRGGHLYEGDAENTVADEGIDINQVQLRVERQVLRRLPRSNAMCMLTKTYLYPLTEIAHEPGFAARLYGLLEKLPTKFAFYKRKPIWGKVVLAYLEEMAKKHPAEEPVESS